MTDQFLGLSARADIHPDMMRFKRQSSPGEWIKSEPIKAWGGDLLAGLLLVAFLLTVIVVL